MPFVHLRIPSHALGKISKNDEVIVTGNFDNWEHTKFVLKHNNEDGSLNVKVPSVNSGILTFKFVINGKEWITLPYFETRKDDLGFLNNVLQCCETEDERLDEITISSPIRPPRIPDHSESTDQIAVGNSEITVDNTVDNDYIHVSSQDELSSTENVDLAAHCSYSPVDEDHERTPQSREMSFEIPASQRRIQSLVSVAKRVKMYWSS